MLFLMKLLRFLLAVISVAGLAGWLWLREPDSPSDALPEIIITAFVAHALLPEAGYALANTARSWEGVTATTYNPASDLLVITHWTAIEPVVLQSNLQKLTSRPLERKIFPEPAGPKCPVPQETLAALPVWFLGAGIIALVLFFWLTALAWGSRTPSLTAD